MVGKRCVPYHWPLPPCSIIFVLFVIIKVACNQRQKHFVGVEVLSQVCYSLGTKSVLDLLLYCEKAKILYLPRRFFFFFFENKLLKISQLIFWQSFRKSKLVALLVHTIQKFRSYIHNRLHLCWRIFELYFLYIKKMNQSFIYKKKKNAPRPWNISMILMSTTPMMGIEPALVQPILFVGQRANEFGRGDFNEREINVYSILRRSKETFLWIKLICMHYAKFILSYYWHQIIQQSVAQHVYMCVLIHNTLIL